MSFCSSSVCLRFGCRLKLFLLICLTLFLLFFSSVGFSVLGTLESGKGFFLLENENNSVLKGFFDIFFVCLLLFSSTEHTRRARENWLGLICVCVYYLLSLVFFSLMLLQRRRKK